MTLFWTNGIVNLYHADARALPLDDASVHCAITSPPYWGLRNYGLGEWTGGDAECDHKRNLAPSAKSTLSKGSDGRSYPSSNETSMGWIGGICGHCGATQSAEGIGLEPTLGEWLYNMRAVGREVWRVLRDDGTWWCNIGDAYANNSVGGASPDGERRGRKNLATTLHNHSGLSRGSGLPSKNLLGMPWRLAFALRDDGWIVRSDIIWHKPNPMPESVRDRPTSAHEHIFLLTKRPRYFYDAEAVRDYSGNGWRSNKFAARSPERHAGENRTVPSDEQPAGANARNVWTIPSQGRSDAHFATFCDELPRRCILAGTSERGVCADCGAPWERVVENHPQERQRSGGKLNQHMDRNDADGLMRVGETNRKAIGWQPTCACDADTLPPTVLDPFIGSGTTAAVAQSLGRRAIGVDLNPEYLEIARRRIEAVNLPLL